MIPTSTRAAVAGALRSARALLPGAADLRAVRRSPGRDLLAGATVAIVALPLALAFGEASGLGARAGLITAVLAGAVAAVFGGSNLQVSGPTGAMTVVLVPVVHQYGPRGMLEVGAMAGVLLLVLAVTRIGRAVRYLPAPLVEGFTAGIAVVIALQQVPNALGVAADSQPRVWAVAADAVGAFIRHPDPLPVLVALGVAAVVLAGARWLPRIPLSLLAVAVVTALAALLHWRLPYIGILPPLLSAPRASFFDPAELTVLLPSAAAVAALAALESLLCATVADGMTIGERHDPDRELFGQGLANLIVPFFGGVPATAAIARTAVNVRSGAHSRLAALTHSAVLLGLVLVAAPVVGDIPLAALAGVLLATTVQMIDPAAIRGILRSGVGDAAVLIVTFAITVAVDLVTAVAVGFGIAVLLALRQMARTARLDRTPLTETAADAHEEQRLLDEHIVAYRIDGPLFFGAAQRFLHELSEVTDVAVLILRLGRVSTLDVTGVRMLGEVVRSLERRGTAVLLSGLRPGHSRMLMSSPSLVGLVAEERVFDTTPEAIAAARRIVAVARG